MQTKEFDYKEKKLVYRIKGEGPLLVLLHGFGEDGTVWKAQYDLFESHRLIIPDLPGSGESEIIDDMSMEGMADAIFALLNGEFHLEEMFILIGHSMGGYITLAFAEKYPDVLNAFGLFHSTAFADSDEKKQTRKKGIQFIKEHGGYEFLKTAIPNLYSPETKQTSYHLVEKHIEAVRNANTDALVSYYEAMMKRPDRTNVLINSRVPVLFVLGEYDTAVPVEDGLKLCHLPQLSYIHVLPGSGHMGMVEEAEESNKILSHFVTTVENIAYT
jgi:pimeloyl-ACP methyl ester carboxylesterase